jgi:molybdopterin-guanine dinucleotide biosynthesis protein A
MVTAPCDVPNFPVDLVERLAHGLAGARAQIAMAATRGNDGTRVQPAFCLIDSSLLEDLAQFLQAGRRQVTDWTRGHRGVEVVFDDASGFLGVV